MQTIYIVATFVAIALRETAKQLPLAKAKLPRPIPSWNTTAADVAG